MDDLPKGMQPPPRQPSAATREPALRLCRENWVASVVAALEASEVAARIVELQCHEREGEPSRLVIVLEVT